MQRSVLFVIGNLDVGGAERHLVQVLPVLKRSGINVTVFTITHKGHLAPMLERAGVKIVQPFWAGEIRKLPKALRRTFTLFASTISLFKEVKKDYQIIHFFLPTAYLLGGIVTVVCSSRRMIMSRRSLNHYQTKHPILSRIERWLHGKMDAVLANSLAVHSDLEAEGVRRDRLGLIYNGIEALENKKGRRSLDVRGDLNLSENTLLFVIVANLIEYKGHADLISAFEIAAKSLPDEWAVLVVGKDCGIGERLRAQANGCGIGGHVRWLGLREDIHDLLPAADVGILCSHEEGFSNSILEYMAAALPVIATDVGGSKEAVLDGKTGIVVQSRNPVGLAKAIVAMSADSEVRLKMGTAGHARFVNNFTLDVCVSRYENLYSGLLNSTSLPVQEIIDGRMG